MRKTLATVVLALWGAAVAAGCVNQATPIPLPTATSTPVATATATPYAIAKHMAEPEAIDESLKPQYNVPAITIAGETLPHTQAQLIRDSSYFISYPQPIVVIQSCLEAQVSAYSSGDIGVAPRPDNKNHQLYGFAVWIKRAGAGNTRMNQDILQLGRSCQPNYQPNYNPPVETPQLKF